jgi:hypothetical protein
MVMNEKSMTFGPHCVWLVQENFESYADYSCESFSTKILWVCVYLCVTQVVFSSQVLHDKNVS